jgi:pimeloyl-ACP methyl ester carboxylesterase
VSSPELASRLLEIRGIPTELCVGGSGPPLFYLHGLVGDAGTVPVPEEVPPLLGRLARRRRVLAPLLPGFGRSSLLPGVPAADAIEDTVLHLTDVLDALGEEGVPRDAVDVVGTSVGGFVAAMLALRRPERVRRLALVAPLGLHVPGCPVPPLFGAVAPRGVGGFGEARALFFAEPDGEAAVRALPDEMDRERRLLWFASLAGAAMLGWKAPHFQSRFLARHLWRVATPTLVVGAERDRLVPAAHLEAWDAALPAGRLVVLEAAGHAVALERPDDVAGLVLEHLEPAGS